MTQRRQTRASACPTTKVAASKRQLSKENATAPRTRGVAQPKKSLPSLTKTMAATSAKLQKKKTTVSSMVSSKVPSKPTAPKKTDSKKIAKPSVKSPAASKRTSLKLSTKSAKSNFSQKVGKPIVVPASCVKSLRPKETSSKPLSLKPSIPKSVSSNTLKSSPRFLKTANFASLNNSSPSKENVKASSTSKTAPSMEREVSKRTPSKRTPLKQTPSKETISKEAPATRGSLKRTPSERIALKQPPQSPAKRSPVKQTALKQSLKSPLKRSPLKQTALKQSSKSPARQSPLKQTALKQSPKSPEKQSLSKQTAIKQSPKSPSHLSPFKQTAVQRTPPKQTSKQLSPCNPNIHNRSSRKRLLPSPVQSPHSAKVRKLREKAAVPAEIKLDQESDDCVALDEIGKKCPVVKGKKKDELQRNLKPTKEQSSEPELSNSFLRRKWFSLKARGGFTCLRSAVLSPQEVANEVIEHANVDKAASTQESDLFSTKLMVRLASRLPPVRARPSCEELVDLINSKRNGSKAEPLSDPKKEGTAIRVKVENRSFSETLTHLKTRPVRSSGIAGQSKIPQSKLAPVKRKAESKYQPAKQKDDGSFSEKQEREIALRQLEDLRTPKPENSNPGKSADAPSTSPKSNLGFENGRRWFSLKGSGTSTALRSAILSPEELTAEFMKRTKVDPQACLTAQSLLKQGSRGSYKGVSTDELVNLIQSKQMEKHMESLKPKVEETISDPEKTREKQLALQQLNVLRYW